MLPKLADTKSGFDKNTSLLSYMVKHLYKIRPTLLALGSEPKLQEAGKVSFAEVESGINTLTQETKQVKAMVLTVQAALKGKDKRFEATIVPFMEEAERTLKHLDELYKETCGLFLSMCMWFGWPEAKAKSITNDKFFAEMHLFMEAFMSLWKVEEAVEERKNFEKMVKKKERLDSLTEKDPKKPKQNGTTKPAKDKGAPVAQDDTSKAAESSKTKLVNKFRNSAQKPFAPLPVGGPPPEEPHPENPPPAKSPPPAIAPLKEPTPVSTATPTSSSSALKQKFRQNK
jgi:hypothetical protein